MEKKTTKVLATVVACLVIISASVFAVGQTQQVIILQFGEPVRVVKKPGLSVKMPFFQDAVFFDNRVMDLGIQEQEVIASDQKRLIINAFTKYKIEDPLKFYTTVHNQYGLESKLSAVLDSSLRQVIGEVTLSELLTENRSTIMSKIKEIVSKESEIFGIEIVDVRIMRGDLPKENSDAIFARMQTEREKEAKEIRAKGSEEGQKIKAEAEKERTILLAESKKKSDLLRGEGDAHASKVYANAFGRDPEFADFYRSMKAYREALQSDKTKIMVISPEGEFFKHFNGSSTKY